MINVIDSRAICYDSLKNEAIIAYNLIFSLFLVIISFILP